MSQIDVNQEWLELQESYSAMSDEELATLANDGYDLTDIAKQALQAEISRRRLNVQLQQQEPAEGDEAPEQDDAARDTEFDASELDDIGRVWSLEEAMRMKETLDSSGVPVFFGPERVEDPRMLRAGFEHGIDVRVRDFDQQRAMAALAQAQTPGESDSQEGEEEDAPYTARCPKCHSTEIVFQNLDVDPVTKSAFDSKFNWSCDACGYRWKDDGIESET